MLSFSGLSLRAAFALLFTLGFCLTSIAETPEWRIAGKNPVWHVLLHGEHVDTEIGRIFKESDTYKTEHKKALRKALSAGALMLATAAASGVAGGLATVASEGGAFTHEFWTFFGIGAMATLGANVMFSPRVINNAFSSEEFSSDGYNYDALENTKSVLYNEILRQLNEEIKSSAGEAPKFSSACGEVSAIYIDLKKGRLTGFDTRRGCLFSYKGAEKIGDLEVEVLQSINASLPQLVYFDFSEAGN